MAAAVLLTLGWSVGTTKAAVFISVFESGADVVATGGGSINTNALTYDTTSFAPAAVGPDSGALVVGSGGNGDAYSGFTGPAVIGPGTLVLAASATGDAFGILAGFPAVVVPESYVSQTPLSGTATWTGSDMATLGLVPGNYVWSWGSGADADTLTVNVAPEPSALLLGVAGGLGLLARRRRRGLR